ncbi:MAG: hypothetical protein JM58_16260 [Peptococcaceae bacterium BICA1-8]|nr:MAG: hypothetical protein JM58_16260 [Peptococcaceae bacterium BICA1-8]
MIYKDIKLTENELSDALMEETETNKRQLKGIAKRIVGIIAVMMALFHLYTAGFGVMVAVSQRGIHLSFILVLIFLLYPATKNACTDRIAKLDIFLAFLSLLVAAYPVVFQEKIQRTAHLPIETMQYVFGWIFILLVLEATRRIVGNQLTIIAIIFFLYCYFGYLVPGDLGHAGFSWKRIVRHMYLTQEGIFGIALGVSATYIVLFVLFGAFLEASGMAKFFNDLSMAVAGNSPGGPAKVAIIFSCLLGMISGSAPANVATTGSFTIPLMKKIGYKPAFAGAVEAVASTGGQIMPPIMGAVAFIMADFLQMPYWQVAISALIPGVLFYFACFVAVHLRAIRRGLVGVPSDLLPKVKDTLFARGHLVIPIIFLIFLLVKGYSPMYAAFYSIISILLVSQLKKETRLTLKSIYNSLEKGAYSAIGVGMACAVVGIVVGTASLTSIGMVFGEKVMSLGQDNILLSLILTMLTVMVLGMGVPTVAAYVIASLIAAPGLLKLGIEPLAVHMFILYFAILATITPPVALSSYTAAAIAGSNPNETGWVAFKLAIPGFIIPFTFVYSPVLLLIDASALQIIGALITAFLGVFMLTAGLEGYLLRNTTLFERIIMIAGAVSLIFPELYSDIFGLLCSISVYLMQKNLARSVHA